MYSYYIEEMVKALAQTPEIVTLADDKFQLNEELARKALEAYWADYAVSVFEFRQIVEAAERNSVPVTPADVRKILHNVEEGVVSVDHNALDEGVTDFGMRFDWLEPDVPVDYEAYTLKTCDWLVVLHRKGNPNQELPGWDYLEGANATIRNVDSRESLADAIRFAKAHDKAEEIFLPSEERLYCVYAVESFPSSYTVAAKVKLLKEIVHTDNVRVFDSEYDSFEGFGAEG